MAACAMHGSRYVCYKRRAPYTPTLNFRLENICQHREVIAIGRSEGTEEREKISKMPRIMIKGGIWKNTEVS